MKSSMQAVMITPSMANALLQVNHCNRPKGAVDIKDYAQLMKAGAWKLNGETIKVREDGVLLDGQHRLEACVLADTPFPTWIVTVEDKDSFDTIDIGRRRSPSDTLAVIGEKNTAVLGTVLGMVLRYYEEGLELKRSNKKLTPTAILKALEVHPEARDSVAWACSYKHKTTLIPRTVIAFCHYVFSRIDDNDANYFMDKIITGEGLVIGDSALALRSRMITNAGLRHRGIKEHPVSIAAHIFKAWNYYRRNRRCGVLKWLESEAFPIPK